MNDFKFYMEFFTIPDLNIKKIEFDNNVQSIEDLKNSKDEKHKKILNGEFYFKKKDNKGKFRFWFVFGDYFYGLRFINKGSFIRIFFGVVKNLNDPIDGKIFVKNKNFPKVFGAISKIAEKEIPNFDKVIFSFRPAKNPDESNDRKKTVRGRLYSMVLKQLGYKDIYIDDEQYLYFSKSKTSEEIKKIIS